VLLALVLLGVAYVGVLEYQRPHVAGDSLRFDTFVNLVANGNVRSATVLDQDAYITGAYVPPKEGEDLSGGDEALHDMPTMEPDFGGVGEQEQLPTGEGGVRRFNAPLLRNTQGSVLDMLISEGVPTEVDQQVGKQLAQFASLVLPGVMLVVLLIYLILSYRSGTGLFGIRSGAQRFAPEDAGGVGFADVAGQDAALAELREVADYLADPARFGAVGAVAPKGVLLYGPPGCGKTLLAKALAGEAGASFFSISGSDFVELYAGVGAARVRDLFREAREAAPALVFIDELDAIGRARASSAASQGEQEQALNQILTELDGFAASEGLIVLAATNRPDMLDQALLRPGRFDRTVGLERPDEDGRHAILSLHAGSRELADDVDLEAIAGQAVGLTGADLATVTNEAALLAARAGKPAVSQAEFEAAVQRVLEAPERQRRLSLTERSVAKTATAEDRITLADVAGVDDAVAELDEVAAYLADPDRFAAMGARAPKGVLLSGPPGCGKTLLGRALAGEANAAFLSASGSDFVEVFAGKGAQRVRDLFAEANAVAPAIVFLDEIDAIGATRQASGDGGQEREQTLNQILVELDGFEPRSGVVVIAATNRPDILDPALTRPGRFDRQVAMSLPDRGARHDILELHAGDKPLAGNVDLNKVADRTPGFSGAALGNVFNDAALLATRRGEATISMGLVEEAIERAATGVAGQRWIMTDAQRRVAAYHEAGRGLATQLLTNQSPGKLSLAAGGRHPNPGLDQHDPLTLTRDRLVAHMGCVLAGRAAEDLAFAQPSAAAGPELAQAEALAHQMVCQLGMSPRLGVVAYPDTGGDGHARHSEHTAQLIDAEKHALITEAYELALSILQGHRELLEELAAALLAHETVTLDHHTTTFGEREEPPSDGEADEAATTPASSGNGGRGRGRAAARPRPPPGPNR
jgi:cell division protease FtsH